MRLPAGISIEPATPGGVEALLPLIGEYQHFYGVDEPDERRNRGFFERFLAPSEAGVLLGAWDGATPVGFACVYFRPESVSAREVAYLHDLYVSDATRGRGVGRALIDRAAALSRERGFPSLSWQTAVDNRRAQRLYETYPARRTIWFEYELDLPDGAA